MPFAPSASQPLLPAATTPNAIAFGSAVICIPTMAQAGVWLNLADILTVTVVCDFMLDIVLARL